MPTTFLKNRYAKALREAAGDGTVQYFKFVGPADSLTGDVDESTAYSSTPIDLPACIDFNPSKALREKIGLDIKFDAVLNLARDHVVAAAITLKVGDAFLLSGDPDRYVVEKLIRDEQAGADFLGYTVAVSRQQGGR